MTKPTIIKFYAAEVGPMCGSYVRLTEYEELREKAKRMTLNIEVLNANAEQDKAALRQAADKIAELQGEVERLKTENEALNEKRLQLGRDYSDKMETLEKVLDKGLYLKWILRRWADISPKLDDFDIVEGQSPELRQLIEDTKNV